MASRGQVPKFGDWENKQDVPYTVYFEKAKKDRNSKKKPQIYDPFSDNETSFPARGEAEIKYSQSAKSEPERPKDQDPQTKQESHVIQEKVDLRESADPPTRPKNMQVVASDRGYDSSQMHQHRQEKVRNRGSTGSSMWEEVDLRKSTDSSAHTKRISRQSVGSDQSFDSSPLNPHQQERVKNNFTTSSALWERKVLSEGSHGSAAFSAPERSRLRQVTLDENTDDSPAIPKFGDWDDNDPRSGERYTQVFNKARENKHAAGGKSPAITIENANFYGHRDENLKGCTCFPWGRK